MREPDPLLDSGNAARPDEHMPILDDPYTPGRPTMGAEEELADVSGAAPSDMSEDDSAREPPITNA